MKINSLKFRSTLGGFTLALTRAFDVYALGVVLLLSSFFGNRDSRSKFRHRCAKSSIGAAQVATQWITTRRDLGFAACTAGRQAAFPLSSIQTP